MPDLVKATIIDSVANLLTSYGPNDEMDETTFMSKVEAAHAALDAMAYTVNPSSPVHPSTPR